MLILSDDKLKTEEELEFENAHIGAIRSIVRDNKRIFYQRTEKGWKFFQEEDYDTRPK